MKRPKASSPDPMRSYRPVVRLVAAGGPNMDAPDDPYSTWPQYRINARRGGSGNRALVRATGGAVEGDGLRVAGGLVEDDEGAVAGALGRADAVAVDDRLLSLIHI